LIANSDDFVFDNQTIIQAIAGGFRIGEISCPTSYHAAASSINFARSVRYGLGVISGSLQFLIWRMGIATPRFLDAKADNTLEHLILSKPMDPANQKPASSPIQSSTASARRR
jgi:hypothetical protein